MSATVFVKRYLGDRAFWRMALQLSLPIAFQNLLVNSFTLVDTLMVSQLGDVALSSVGMAGEWNWMMGMVLFGLTSGMAIFVSQYWGVGDREGIHRVHGITLLFGLVLSLIFSLTAMLFPEEVIWVFNKDPRVIASGAAYLQVAAASYPAVVISSILSTLLRSTEQVLLPMYVSLFSTVANASLNYVLIFGKLGLPALGVRGAAIATCGSAWLGVLLLVALMAVKKNFLLTSPRKLFSFTRRTVGEYWKKSAPVTLNESLWGLGTLLFSVIFANMGHEEYASMTIVRSFTNISFVFFIGLCSACCVMVGKRIGAGEIQQAVDDSRRFTVLVPLLSAVLGALFIVFRHELVMIFNMGGNVSARTLELAAWLLLITALELPLRNIPYIVICGVFRSGGETKKGMWYDIIGLWFMSVPATLIAAYVLDLPFLAVYAIMYVFEDYLKVILCLRYLVSGKWIRPVTEQGIAGLEAWRAGRTASGK